MPAAVSTVMAPKVVEPSLLIDWVPLVSAPPVEVV
jgi:hypothetical protein